MKQKAVQGSIVLLVLIIMSILMLIMHTAVTRESFLKIMIAKQASQEKNMALCRGLHRYAVRTAQDQYDTIREKNQEVVLEIPLDQTRGAVFLIPISDGISIKSELWQENILLSNCSCDLTQNSEKKFIIQGFQR